MRAIGGAAILFGGAVLGVLARINASALTTFGALLPSGATLLMEFALIADGASKTLQLATTAKARERKQSRLVGTLVNGMARTARLNQYS